jgi:hypothetical protein
MPADSGRTADLLGLPDWRARFSTLAPARYWCRTGRSASDHTTIAQDVIGAGGRSIDSFADWVDSADDADGCSGGIKRDALILLTRVAARPSRSKVNWIPSARTRHAHQSHPAPQSAERWSVRTSDHEALQA